MTHSNKRPRPLLDHNDSSEIYRLCRCCGYFYQKKFMGTPKNIHLTSPRLKQFEWYGVVSSEKINQTNNRFDSIYIDTKSFEKTGFSVGDSVLVKVLEKSFCARIFPSMLPYLGTVHISEILFKTHNLVDFQPIQIKSAPDVPISHKLIVSVHTLWTSYSSEIELNLRTQLGICILNVENTILSIHDRLTFKHNQNDINIEILYSQNDSEDLVDKIHNLSFNSPCTHDKYFFLIKTPTTQMKFKFTNNSILPIGSIPGEFHPSKIMGIDKYLKIFKKLIYSPLQYKEFFNKTAQYLSKGALVHGISGVGKCSIIYKFCAENSLSLYSIDHRIMLNKNNLVEFKQLLLDHHPDVVLLKHIEIIYDAKGYHSNSDSENLYLLLDIIKNCDAFCIGTCSDIDAIHHIYRSSGVFDFEIEISCPDDSQRKQILQSFLSEIKHSLTRADIDNINQRTRGFVPADIKNLITQAIYCSCERMSAITADDTPNLSAEDFIEPLQNIQPSVIRDTSVLIPKCSWSDIGGMEQVKQRVRECVEWPLKYPNEFRRMDIDLPSGVLLYGPPGCSKTMIARALAKESGLNFISIRGPELVNKYVGETERAIRNLFKKARSAAPCIIFFDELDSLTTNASSEKNSNYENRILSQLLTEIDGISNLSGSVVVVGATNKPTMLDSALIRPGRFDRFVYVPPPDDVARKEILTIKFNKMPVSEDVDISILVSQTNKFTGAEIVNLCREAALRALKRDINALSVTMNDFESVLLTMKPSFNDEDLAMFEGFRLRNR